jgi:hypothetical protein
MSASPGSAIAQNSKDLTEVGQKVEMSHNRSGPVADKRGFRFFLETEARLSVPRPSSSRVAACVNILHSRRRICDGAENTHELLSEGWSAHSA